MHIFTFLELPKISSQTRPHAARLTVWIRALSLTLLPAITLFPAALLAQVTTATITGRLLDPTGAVIPKATVTATEQSTGVQTKAFSDKAGEYTLSFLKTGTYTVMVEAKGFSKYVQRDLPLSSVDHPTIDVTLTVGTSDMVVVTEAPPLLSTEDANEGQTVPRQLVEDLPLSGRTPMSFAQYTVGVTATANPVGTRPFDNSAVAAFSVGGLPNKNAEILMDGSPDNASDNAPAYELPLDAAQEITIKIFESDATYGHSGGAVANQITKSGTNKFHGSLDEFNQNNDLDANGFFAKRLGNKIAVSRQNQFGGTIGGPVWIPKLYNGRDKLFFFFAYEGFYDSSANPINTTVPTAAERTGDFSALVAPGNNGYYRGAGTASPDVECKSGSTSVIAATYFTNQIYDPATGVVNAACKALGFTIYDRQPFANNILTSGTLPLSPVALAALKYFPMPTNPNAYLGYLNYTGFYNTGDRYNNELGRIDFRLSPRQSLYLTGRHNQRVQYINQQFGNSNPALGDFLYRLNYGGSVGDIVTFNQSTVMEVRVNYTRYSQPSYTAGDGFNPASVGLPNLPSAHYIFPRFNFNDYGYQNGTQQSLGVTTQTPGTAPFDSDDVFVDVIKTKGLNTFKFGVDFRKFQKGNFTFGNSGGSYNFDNGFTSSFGGNGYNQGYQADFASFMLGLVSNWQSGVLSNVNAPGSATYDFNAHSIGNQSYLGLFYQQDWRARPNLTFNFGLRMDKDFSPNEREGTAVNGFDMTDPNPYQGAAVAAYSAHPNALLPVANFKVLGGVTFNSPTDTKYANFPSIDWSPRLGVSYSPSYLKGTVLRAGFGIFVLPIFPFNNSINQPGFSQTTLSPTVLFAPPTHAGPGTLDNPFPTGLAAATGSLGGLSTFAGNAITFLDPSIKNAYAERWHLGFQHQFWRSWMVDVFYEGSTGRKLPLTKNLDYVQPQYETTASNTSLSAAVANPFYGLIPNGGNINANPTIALTTLMETYPEFSSVTEQNFPGGSSIFNSLDAHLEHRTGYGLSMFANFQWSKEIEAVTYLNPGDAHLERRISQYDHPEHAVIALSYQLPYGKGRRFGHNAHYWLDLPLGGWNVASSYYYQQGAPIAIPNVFVNPNGGALHWYSRQAKYNGGALATCPAFNINYFISAASSTCGQTNTTVYTPVANNIRFLHSQAGNFRADAWNDWDASILKNFDITEHSYFQLRIEGFNVNNRPVFSTPNTNASSTSFGQITGVANGNNGARFFQVGGRVVF